MDDGRTVVSYRHGGRGHVEVAGRRVAAGICATPLEGDAIVLDGGGVGDKRHGRVGLLMRQAGECGFMRLLLLLLLKELVKPLNLLLLLLNHLTLYVVVGERLIRGQIIHQTR
jgi:hypothetical protein